MTLTLEAGKQYTRRSGRIITIEEELTRIVSPEHYADGYRFKDDYGLFYLPNGQYRRDRRNSNFDLTQEVAMIDLGTMPKTKVAIPALLASAVMGMAQCPQTDAMISAIEKVADAIKLIEDL